ncbi:carbon starvation protein A [Treponema phagedenis]|uniref:Carbon starvation protein A n=1 Tax=Treponema phagedenis TaxID=162 RepID=A0A0B7H067_TREPH|nr:carbon starvation protein A [Treponema phagedenis]NVP24243.1 carbon starvation protein A [Treponema phagedenis]QEJ96399.1 carbon starvation protein A [Treponema phagedenis]QEJ99698.1 carbon starvation protein A [Treponema phagedenis]QEK02191.1 carbon starvation protein A [Treponema phagedenis]QEK05247.1 carbon starvation protein A [Treponema phagedenis]
MLTFFICLAILIVGYFLYGKYTEMVFGPTSDPTPAMTMQDGVDYIPLSTPKVFLIQLLNIAGLGPIFGAIAGALWGPSAFLWIALGTIFAGGVHDYLSGMISERHNGASISELSGIYLGPIMKFIMRIFAIVLLVLVGTVFMKGPADLLAKLTPEALNANFWLIVVLIYYFLATLLPIDQIIGKIYPVFGVVLIIMALGIGGEILFHAFSGTMTIPEFSFINPHPKGLPRWPLLFITIACGAISGFHATQSPLMARCIKTEADGRKVFYGAMVGEGIIALIWAAAGMTFYNGTAGLAQALSNGGPAAVVYDISFSLLKHAGGFLAILGVIACPITSGDTAFRSARLTIADWFKVDQKPWKSRLLISIPLLGVGGLLTRINFDIIWRYFAWSNQTLAMIALWVAAMYLFLNKKNYFIAVVPATFMSAVSMTYILIAPEGFRLPQTIAYPAGIIFAVACLLTFVIVIINKKKKGLVVPPTPVTSV